MNTPSGDNSAVGGFSVIHSLYSKSQQRLHGKKRQPKKKITALILYAVYLYINV